MAASAVVDTKAQYFRTEGKRHCIINHNHRIAGRLFRSYGASNPLESSRCIITRFAWLAAAANSYPRSSATPARLRYWPLPNTDIPLDVEFEMVTLKDRVAIITGASGGLGRVVTRQFSERGARLALLDRSSERLKELVSDLKLTEDRYLLSASDLTNPEAVDATAKDVIAKFGRAEILLNLVGGFVGGKKVVELARDDLSNMLQQHVWTTFHLAQAFVPHMIANRWGRFLVISSPRALDPRGNNAAYAIGKAGEEVLTLSLAQELKDTGVTANVILVRSIDVEHRRDREPTPENASSTTPEEIAAAIMYLCSDEARTVSGARIPLHGA